jgi:hypothetical protein
MESRRFGDDGFGVRVGLFAFRDGFPTQFIECTSRTIREARGERIHLAVIVTRSWLLMKMTIVRTDRRRRRSISSEDFWGEGETLRRFYIHTLEII